MSNSKVVIKPSQSVIKRTYINSGSRVLLFGIVPVIPLYSVVLFYWVAPIGLS